LKTTFSFLSHVGEKAMSIRVFTKMGAILEPQLAKYLLIERQDKCTDFICV
jgi:hypothetical protein